MSEQWLIWFCNTAADLDAGMQTYAARFGQRPNRAMVAHNMPADLVQALQARQVRMAPAGYVQSNDVWLRHDPHAPALKGGVA